MMKGLRVVWLLLGLVALAGCATPPQTQGPTQGRAGAIDAAFPSRLDADSAARQFAQVVSTVEPVAERYCRAARNDDKCDFHIIVDTRKRSQPNAFQTIDDNGQPVLIFTIALIADMRNPDELAFVMSHEASHHIRDHLSRQRFNADTSAREYGQAAASKGASRAAIRRAVALGAELGARSYSKQFELEADYLGAQIARSAGYNPLIGAQYFQRLPDPGEQFQSSHPPNAERMATVRAALRQN
ncbi:M48 family metalloprotease [Pseudooceanicola spongiae]|uniref:M48 family metalloprotease n=2 Tax=Pseudooceanicola spongiae TaxID=2613965 RepID=A0A7L9WRU2_9RHOB|nr:M48 family metalloprotease [Pseudooceanicola spongiae]